MTYLKLQFWNKVYAHCSIMYVQFFLNIFLKLYCRGSRQFKEKKNKQITHQAFTIFWGYFSRLTITCTYTVLN